MKLFPILTVIANIHIVQASLLTSEERQLISCQMAVLNQHFIPGRRLLFSLPQTGHNATQQRAIVHTLKSSYDSHVLDFMLKTIHHESRWHLCLSTPDDESSSEPTSEVEGKIDYYLVVTTPEHTDDEISENALQQFGSFQRLRSWNQRADFFVMVTGKTQQPKLFALKLFDKLWKSENIMNIVLLVPTYDNATNKEEPMAFELYTWFPYRSGHCANVQEVTILDRWIITDNGYSFKDVLLFPQKIPLNLQACPLKVSVAGSEPYVFRHDIQDGNIQKYRGLEIEFLHIVSKFMNMTLVYLPTPAGSSVSQRTSILMSLSFGELDVVLGAFPMHLSILEFADATTPYLQTVFQWFVPCPTPVPRIETILGIFTVPVWLTLILVLILTTATVCFLGTRSYESALYNSMTRSFHDVWAIFMGVAVARLPRTSRLRIFLLIFLSYCFVINIIFQAFFVTFLVKPGFRRQISTFDDLMNSGLIYAFQEGTEIALNSTTYYDHTKLNLRRMKCLDHEKCLERLMISQDITMISIPLQAEYLAFKLIPIYKRWINVCFLNEDIHKMFFVMYLQLGSPLLDRFNTIILRTIDAGLVDRYWTMLKWEYHLKSSGNSTYDGNAGDNDLYFAFSLSHLKVTFFILFVGYILSFIIFVGELFYATLSKHRK
ncbi:uncharacterized protein LOC110838090 [Zootermopsis nevadensis]|uniref:uncharacterized protein LOC110838090 n=1 Tax=Zootermopsis nevadensis TaxID=136037 RepID=UPI000B8E3057|nr:uncharacterized protein LOC110838090 [Zootermopsis nevadensis]XP_021936628.1 uncharacterized protein LOC110838090 [Zootermopsis nevadensis]